MMYAMVSDDTGFEILQDDFRRTETVFLRAPSSRECQRGFLVR